jgi:hypothetical protein
MYNYIEKNLSKMLDVLGMKRKDFPSKAILIALKKIIKEKR